MSFEILLPFGLWVFEPGVELSWLYTPQKGRTAQGAGPWRHGQGEDTSAARIPEQHRAAGVSSVRADSVRWLGRMNVRTSNGAGATAKAQGQSHSITGILGQQSGCTRWVYAC